MTTPSGRTGAGRVAILGAAALFLAALFAPLKAEAAISDMHFKLGTLSKEHSAPGAYWKPKTGGTFSATYNSVSVLGTGPVLATGAARGALGTASTKIGVGAVTLSRPSRAFTNSYSFSLHKASSLTLNMYVGRLAVETGLIAAGTAFVDNRLTVTLTGKNGLRYTDVIRGGQWTNVWSNLEAGDYTLSVSGHYGHNRAKLLGAFHQGYAGSFQIGQATLGNVPLPGALVLLGTALTGAGVWGRRKKRAGKTA